MAVALWLANNARDWVAQTTREIFDAEDMTQGIAVIQRHTAATLATEIEDGISGEAYTASLEDCDSDLATVDLVAVDYLQIATRIVEDLGCQDHGERGGFCAACGFVRPHVFPCATTGGN
tara:strand:+ start:653 stop:1012 length:360 start_codon:yes stop_codon:yes gene_type:complete